MKSWILFPFVLLIFDLAPVIAQDDFINDSIKHPSPKDKKKQSSFWKWDKVVLGGSVGAFIGDPTFVDLSPLIGYNFFKRLQIGVGPTYNYYSSKRQNLKINIYGARTYARIFIIDQVFIHGEYEWINRPNYYLTKRIDVFGLLAGAGYQQSAEGGFFIVALWELLGDPNYPYGNPILRMGFTIGM